MCLFVCLLACLLVCWFVCLFACFFVYFFYRIRIFFCIYVIFFAYFGAPGGPGVAQGGERRPEWCPGAARAGMGLFLGLPRGPFGSHFGSIWGYIFDDFCDKK